MSWRTVVGEEAMARLLVLVLCLLLAPVAGAQQSEVEVECEPLAPLEPEPPAAPPPSAALDIPLDAAPTQAQVDVVLQRYSDEPSADEVVRAALKAAPAPRAQALIDRARLAAWAPRLGLRARHGQTVDLTSPQAIDPTLLRLRTNHDITLEASLSWDFERLIFRRDEISLLSQDRAEHAQRGRLVREVIGLYFERRRLQVARDLSRKPNPAYSVRIAEVEALLDAFTNGAFRRMMAKSRWTTTDVNTPASTLPSPPKSKSVATP
jgi:hypothetical protein